MQSKPTPSLSIYHSLPRPLFLLSQLFYSLGSFIFDYNETHVLNPNWPPHARFHNGQTMSLSLLLALTSLYVFFRSKRDVVQQKGDVTVAAWIGSLYCAAGLSAIWYPGSDWVDPEFLGTGPRRPQMWLFGGILMGVWVAWLGERRRMEVLRGRDEGVQVERREE